METRTQQQGGKRGRFSWWVPAALSVAIVLVCPPALAERTVMLENDLACNSPEVQQARVRLTRVIITTDNAQAKEDATQEIVSLTEEHCVSLTGIFKVEGRADGLLKITDRKGVPFWLVE